MFFRVSIMIVLHPVEVRLPDSGPRGSRRRAPPLDPQVQGSENPAQDLGQLLQGNVRHVDHLVRRQIDKRVRVSAPDLAQVPAAPAGSLARQRHVAADAVAAETVPPKFIVKIRPARPDLPSNISATCPPAKEGVDVRPRLGAQTRLSLNFLKPIETSLDQRSATYQICQRREQLMEAL